MYIRTKDGVFELDENMNITENYLINSYVNDEDVFGNKDIMYEDLGKIINQADTIEALCDRFVFIDKKYQQEKNRYQVYTRLFEKKNLPKYIQNGTEIYGAIWCEWGLKYVAKMNEDGELELI